MARGRFLIRRAKLAGVEAVEADSDHVFPKHTHEQYGVGVIHRGAQTSLSGRGTVDAEPGNIITVNPGEVHDGAPLGDRGRSWRMLYFDPEVVADVIADIDEGRSGRDEFRHPVLDDVRSADVFGRLYALATDGDPCPFMEAEGLLFSLVDALLSEGTMALPNRASSSIRRAVVMIDDMPAEYLTLSDLAAASGLSRFQLLRGFARQTGLTPHAYQMQKRLDLARRLIRQGHALVDAAAASGFADQSHMTRLFAGKYGITPGAYAAAIA